MAALIQAGNPRRLFQNAAAVLRLGVDQVRNLALPHQRGRLRPGRGIGEQHLHVPRPHIPGIGLVGRSGIAGDPPHDLDLILIVEAGRGQTIRIVDDDRDFGEIARAARGGTGKDHVFHAAAAHRRGPVFAHDPPQGLKQVRLAAAIGADHACQPLVDHQIRGVDEAFEPVEPKSRKAHCAACSVDSPWGGMVAPRGRRVNQDALHMA